MQYRFSAILISFLLAGSATCANDDAPSPSDVAEPLLTVRLVDLDGEPVAGANAGFYHYFDRTSSSWKFVHPVKSDGSGVVRFVDASKASHPLKIYARHHQKKLVAIGVFTEELEDGIADLVMVPECRVFGRITCKQLEQRGRKLKWCCRVIRVGGSGTAIVENSDTPETSLFEFFLPPGDFELSTSTAETHRVTTAFEVPEGRQSLDMGRIEHPATRLALLEGQPAPELRGVGNWINGPPMSLSSLRGRVVLLEFWGYWCGPCVRRSLPQIFKIQEEFQDKPLSIIGIHVDDAENITTPEELDTKLAFYRENVWNGRDITIPVAMTIPMRTPFGGDITGTARAEVCVDYGVWKYPTTVLIDASGTVVGEFEPANPEHMAALREMLKGD